MFNKIFTLFLVFILCGCINANIDYDTIIATQPTSIQDSVDIISTTLTNLDGLNGIGLTYISGELRLKLNSQLTNIDGFSDLTSIGGGINVIDNTNLIHIDELNELTSIGGITISDNDNMESINGFSGLTSIDNDLYIVNNINLVSIDGLSSLTIIGADLIIGENTLLESIGGLSNLALIEGGLTIYDNPLLNINALEGVVILGRINIPQSFISCSRTVYDTFVSNGFPLICLEIVDIPCTDDCDKIQFEWVGKSTQMVLHQDCECEPEMSREYKIKAESI